MINNEYFFGGSVPQNNTTYIKRDADDQLYDALSQGKFCYVLDSRQTGKSSLCVRTMGRLKNGTGSVHISLLGLSTQTTLRKWYGSQILKIREDLELDLDLGWLNKWWQNSSLDELTQYSQFIEQFVLGTTQSNIIIFIDEIDTVLTLRKKNNFDTDDFFGFIKYCYEQRNHKPEYERLTFCLLGTASPHSLIKDKQRTPFNIGTSISIKPFTIKQVEPLMEGLKGKFSFPKKVMTEILAWTGGQPFLTQKLCHLVRESTQADVNDVKNLVKQVVISKIVNNWDFQDHPVHLQTIKTRILCMKDVQNRDQDLSFRLLSLYQKLLLGTVKAENSEDEIELKLTGVVIEKDGNLQIHNLIYKYVFNKNWVAKELKEIKFYAEELDGWCKAKEEQKELYLLYGLRFEDAWAAKQKKEEDGTELNGTEVNFLYDSKFFWEKTRDSLPDGSKYSELIRIIMSWTGGFKIFNDFIVKMSMSYRRKAPDLGKEEKWVYDLLQTHLFNKSEKDITQIEDENLRVHLQKIENDFVSYSNPYLLLSRYGEILEKEEVEYDNSKEHQKLIDMCLIIKVDKWVSVLNKIYCYVFNQKWINQQLLIKMGIKMVRLSNGACISNTPITNNQWNALTNSQGGESSNEIAEGVSFNEALNYIRDLNDRSGMKCRLAEIQEIEEILSLHKPDKELTLWCFHSGNDRHGGYFYTTNTSALLFPVCKVGLSMTNLGSAGYPSFYIAIDD